jgi:hypothetical protein
MLKEIKHRLAGVRRRQRLFRSINWSVAGWFFGALAAIVMALLWRAELGVSVWTPLLAIVIAAATAWVLGFLAPLSWHRSAASIDEHYDLKDRSITALEFAGHDRDDELRRLQVADAAQRLDSIDATAVVPWQRPRWFLPATAATALVAMVMLIPSEQTVVAGVPLETRQVVLEQADYLNETMLEELKELADDDNEELKELVEELEELVEELRDPAVDQREALAKLSMMQESVAAALAAFNLQQTDAAMQSLAASIDSAAAMQKIAADLKAQEYDKAADKLEEFDPSEMSNKERRLVAANLSKLSQELGQANQGQLSESTGEMAEGLEKKNDSQCKGGACKLAGLCRSQSLRKSVCKCLGSQLSRLSECKSQCNKNGCTSNNKSDKPSNNWGRGHTDPLGDEATQIDSSRDQVDVTGQQGDGPSEREVITSAEAEQLASRSYQERYQEFRKQAEAVLESEPLPLGHRETVRNYFESIRPSAEDEN